MAKPGKILISACLMGQPVRYNGRAASSAHPRLAQWAAEGRLLPLCPEMAGGLPVPRPAAEISGGAGGQAVLDGLARVMTQAGDDVSGAFIRGAHAALAQARTQGVRVAILKESSPSCGVMTSYDGSFTGHKTAAAGVTAALLQSAGIAVFSEEQLDAAAACVAMLDSQDR